ncbi:MAG: flagellar hook-associated protein FlgK [Desulfamplus sp.]|nr:flagellar hook-associated protein FlgK [Desulfamplus sp.]
MGGIGSTLQIAKGALAAQQYGLNVTGNNISNVNNPDYSRQSVQQINNNPIKYAGYLFGTGVNSSQVTQSVNQLLENRLTGEKSSLSGFEEAESYIKIIADHFNESSDNSISNVLTDFWNSWNDLSNSPGDDSERLIILENGQELSERFNRAYDYLGQVETEINMKLVNAVDRINNITTDIARLNVDIMGQEQARTSNDKRDQRNSLIDELGQLVDIKVFEQTNGSVVVNVDNGLPIVNGESSYKLAVETDRINWVNSAGKKQDITDKITGGKIGGWLDIRDTVIPKYQADINELSHEVIWAINEQHSQGVGLEYFSNGLTGEYSVGESGWLTSLSYGDKIDHSKNLTMWIEDKTTSNPIYSKIDMDMGVSQAKMLDWQAGAGLTNATTSPVTYKFTVMESGDVSYNLATLTDGQRIGQVQSGGSTASDLMRNNDSIAAQTLTIEGGPSGTKTVEIKYGTGDAKQSAASIAEALNKIDGINAKAAENSAILDVGGFGAGDGDEISFGIYVDGVTHYETFIVDSTLGGINEQFEDAFRGAAKAINGIYNDEDLTLTWDVQDASATQFTLTSKSGRTIGLENVTGGGGSINFSGTAVGAVGSAVKTSQITIGVDKGISISSNVDQASGGLFPTTPATIRNDILTPDKGIIAWEQYGINGLSNGQKGFIEVGLIDINGTPINIDGTPITVQDSSGNELLTFKLDPGKLVAGNTMSLNVNLVNDPASPSYDPSLPTEAKPDPLEFTIKGTANSQNSIYQFKVVNGGTFGTLPNTIAGESPIKIEWNNGVNSGTFEIKELDPPMTPDVPYNVEVDGMTIKFTEGTLFKNDFFTITTDESGKPISTDSNGKATGEMLSDWHWTLDSFKNQFNKDGQGMKATINGKNQLELSTSNEYHVIDNVSYSNGSEKNGFSKENISIDVKDWGAIDFQAKNMQFVRGTDGVWRIDNTPTSISATILPDEGINDGSDDGTDRGFGVDFNGDNLADIHFSFKKTMTGDGATEDYFAFDLLKHDSTDIGFAFSDESGTMAALGFNTFFKGSDALTMGLNDVVKDTNFVAAATIDSKTGRVYKGDNSNTLAIADVQFESLNMKQWSFTRGKEPETSMTTATLNGYYSTMLGSLGVDAKNIQTSKEFSTLMVNYITEQRDSISAVSLDEEMIKLMEYQHAFAAASKLVKTADEMMNTILGLR